MQGLAVGKLVAIMKVLNIKAPSEPAKLLVLLKPFRNENYGKPHAYDKLCRVTPITTLANEAKIVPFRSIYSGAHLVPEKYHRTGSVSQYILNSTIDRKTFNKINDVYTN